MRRLGFHAPIFLSAFLLFQMQPMIGRYLLPWFGGGPAVWTVCMLFFQALLLAGYAYAHWLGSRPGIRLQIGVHLAALAISLLFLPIAPRENLWRIAQGSDPSGRILLLLGVTVGGPYFVLSSTGPLLQRWYHLSYPRQSPWRLYALSNFGSLLALLSYPFVVEPFVRLRIQALTWSVLYAGFVAVCGWTAWRLRFAASKAEEADTAASPQPVLQTILFWVGLAACGSTLLVATTNQISQDVAVVPFLWVAPLSIYLLTFILTFEGKRWYRRALFACAAGVLGPAACAAASASVSISWWGQLGLYLAALFVACMVCHGELALSRPSPRHLTVFYLAIAAGGALGGAFVALAAPRWFAEFSEYPLGLAAACLLGLAGWQRTGDLSRWTRGGFGFRIPIVALAFGGATSVAAMVAGGSQATVAHSRNFYGILRVAESADANGPLRELTHGRIRHGFQYLEGPQRNWPTSYYGPHSGAGIALRALAGRPRRIAVIGLGTGTLAAWGHSGDTFRFYEINPDVEIIARSWFSFLKDSPARTEVVPGDARMQLASEPADAPRFDAIAVDAFSGDAIPLHLLTAECGDIYRRRLLPGGLLLLHISNRSLNLEPVARGLARHLGWTAALFASGPNQGTGESTSRWVLITENAGFLGQAGVAGSRSRWTDGGQPVITWTDDFASLWHVLRF